jgi:lipopolysaccharide/colanic/teichoic acid biosynthesis glycosyltransferase/GGDEF domain-containing protein
MGNSYLRIPALWERSAGAMRGQKATYAFDSSIATRTGFSDEETFHNMLTLERRRAERSRKPFVLMVLDTGASADTEAGDRFASQVTSVLLKSIRETDIVGWYKKETTLGIIFTEISLEFVTPITEILQTKVVNALQNELGGNVASRIVVSVHLFPENRNPGGDEPPADIKLYPDLTKGGPNKAFPQAIKRVIDIAGSGALLLLFGPILAAIALAIKLTSKGSVIFRQERIGQFGARFKCLKFRTMYTNNDSKIHQDFIQQFIAGQAGTNKSEPRKTGVYKITNDPRITAIGRFLRKTSLDEFPQFWNVLRGEMSLVGPRPPVPYEFRVYDTWHRRRVLEVKPGVTGLWQVSGRSRTSFDDMVRLDLRYSQCWSLGLDLKILMATPRAVLGGEGAY